VSGIWFFDNGGINFVTADTGPAGSTVIGARTAIAIHNNGAVGVGNFGNFTPVGLFEISHNPVLEHDFVVDRQTGFIGIGGLPDAQTRVLVNGDVRIQVPVTNHAFSVAQGATPYIMVDTTNRSINFLSQTSSADAVRVGPNFLVEDGFAAIGLGGGGLPSERLDVNGNIRARSDIYADGRIRIKQSNCTYTSWTGTVAICPVGYYMAGVDGRHGVDIDVRAYCCQP
jgi:hypothetical protein